MEKSENIKDMSIYEASDFWDEHDFGEFDDVQEEKEMQFLLKKKKYVGIDTELYAIIKSKAKALNKGEDALINEWLSEKASV
jgi:hypothetical protein